MHIIKLNAIDSTNSYLKKEALKKRLKSYTVVMANHQQMGRGQMGTSWDSDKGKNLTISILVNFNNFKIEHQFYLSMAVSLGVLTVVNQYVKTMLFIKWPNDILAVKDKVAGILIENVLKGNHIDYTVIGVGLNVNQTEFNPSLSNITSLKKITGRHFDLDEIVSKLIASIQSFVNYIESKDFKKLKQLYINELYKFNKPAMFKDNNGVLFLGKITDIADDGRLVVTLENETTRKFNLKEIKFASHK